MTPLVVAVVVLVVIQVQEPTKESSLWRVPAGRPHPVHAPYLQLISQVLEVVLTMCVVKWFGSPSSFLGRKATGLARRLGVHPTLGQRH